MKYIYRIINKIIEKLESIANHYIYTTLGKEALCVIRSILYTIQCTVHRRMKKDANIYIKYTSSKHTPRFFWTPVSFLGLRGKLFIFVF